MGRRKLEMKRIEDKSSRQVTFSKRRSGLFKKARHLSLLCEVDIAVIVFSARGKLYEFSTAASSSSSSNNSVEQILSRYQKSCHEAEERTIRSADKDLCKDFRTCKELLQIVDRLVEENNTEELSVDYMTQLELELDDALVQTRLRKEKKILIARMEDFSRRLEEYMERSARQHNEIMRLIGELVVSTGFNVSDWPSSAAITPTATTTTPPKTAPTSPILPNTAPSVSTFISVSALPRTVPAKVSPEQILPNPPKPAPISLQTVPSLPPKTIPALPKTLPLMSTFKTTVTKATKAFDPKHDTKTGHNSPLMSHLPVTCDKNYNL